MIISLLLENSLIWREMSKYTKTVLKIDTKQ